jgi:hypothetical protein
MTSRPDPDLFAERDHFGLPASGGAVPDEVLAGLGKLAGGPPLWGTPTEWLELVEAAARLVLPLARARVGRRMGRGVVVRREHRRTPGPGR